MVFGIAFVGYPVEPAVVVKLMEMGWRLGHLSEHEWEWRKPNQDGKWIIKQGGDEWRRDFERAKKDATP